MIETDEKMEYLYNMYPERVVREIVDTTVGFWNFGLMQMDTVEVDECGSHWIEINTKGASIIPKGSHASKTSTSIALYHWPTRPS